MFSEKLGGCKVRVTSRIKKDTFDGILKLGSGLKKKKKGGKKVHGYLSNIWNKISMEYKELKISIWMQYACNNYIIVISIPEFKELYIKYVLVEQTIFKKWK